MKNPTAMQDSFWKIFLNLWILACSSISQIVYVFLPGRKTNNYYICIGEPYSQNDSLNDSEPVKVNYSVIAIVILSFFIYVFTGLRMFYFKHWQSKKDQVTLFETQVGNSRFFISTQTLFSFTSNGLILFCLVSCFSMPVIVNKISYSELAVYPHYLWFYIMHHGTPSTTIALTATLYYHRYPILRKHVWAEFQQNLIQLRSWKRTRTGSKTITLNV
jgi:hypothetical protein